ncbi:ribosome small subunit-dependent GTPase A [Caldicellulosiruptoraceae bacterium PP1]
MIIEGIISKIIAGFYYVDDFLGNKYECKARGVFRKEEIKPVVGDKVIIENRNDGAYIISKINERKNLLIRPPIANVDIAIVVIASVMPEVSLLFLDKLLINILKENIKPILCVNKIDLDNSETYNLIKEQYFEFDIIKMSAIENIGFEELREKISGKISVFAGQSGVGKSSILNRLIPNANLKVGDISNKLERGKHTTRVVELLKLDNSTYVADTPGFSSIELKDFLRSDLKRYYPEFIQYMSCRFKSCDHINEPGCTVKEAVQNNKISYERYERYKELYYQLPNQKIYY